MSPPCLTVNGQLTVGIHYCRTKVYRIYFAILNYIINKKYIKYEKF